MRWTIAELRYRKTDKFAVDKGNLFCRHSIEARYLCERNGAYPHEIILQTVRQRRSPTVNMERAANGSRYNDQIRPRTSSRVIEAMRDEDDKYYMSRLHWVLFMTIQHCVVRVALSRSDVFHDTCTVLAGK